MSNKPLLTALFTIVMGTTTAIGAMMPVDESKPNARRNRVFKSIGLGFIIFAVILATILNINAG